MSTALKENYRKSVTVSMPAQLFARAKAYAQKQRMPLSWIICDLLEIELKQKKTTSK